MKVGVVGSGYVGATAAFALVLRGVGREVVLVDKNPQRAESEAADIRHAVPFAHPLVVRAGGFKDLAGCQAVIVAAGVNQKPGETRLQLLRRNAEVFREIVPAILTSAPEAILVVATNPVDVMTHLAARLAADRGVPRGRVFGSGTTLDTARYRSLLGDHCGVDSHHVHAYVIGEHGDSEVLTWSLVTVGGMPLEDFVRLRGIRLDDANRQAIDQCVRGAAYSIIQGKGATYYGIGGALAKIIDAVLHDQRAVMTVSALTDGIAGADRVTISLPRLIGGDGVLATLPPPLDGDESAKFRASCQVIQAAIDELEVAS